jgi:cell division transport system permease protein
MRVIYVSKYFLNEAVDNLWTNRFNNFVSIAIITFSLFTLGLFLLTAENLGRLIGQWTENVQVNLFLQKGVTRDQMGRLESMIKLSPCVGKYEFVSEEDALRRFKEYYPGMKAIASDLDANPFPPSYEITIRREFQNRASVQDFVNQLRSEGSVADVEYDQEWIDRVQFIVQFVRIVGLFFGVVLVFTSVFSISNVIKLMVLSRRDEIEIMRLVGATNSFIKGPFLTEGILQGIVGSFIALLLLFGIYRLILAKVIALNAPFFSANQLHFLSAEMITGLVVGGMVVGFFGSLVSLGKLLKI